jgi:hypothetical protein
MEYYGETQLSINKCLLDYASSQSKHRLLKGEFDSLSARMGEMDTKMSGINTLVTNFQTSLNGNLGRINAHATSLEDLRTSLSARVNSVNDTCDDLRQLIISSTSVPSADNPEESITIADALSAVGTMQLQIVQQISEAAQQAGSAFEIASNVTFTLSGLQLSVDQINTDVSRLDANHSNLMMDSTHDSLCLWQHVKMLRDNVDPTWRHQIGYPNEEGPGKIPRYVNFSPSGDSAQFRTMFVDHPEFGVTTSFVPVSRARRDPFFIPLPDSPKAGTTSPDIVRSPSLVNSNNGQEGCETRSPTITLGMPPHSAITRWSPLRNQPDQGIHGAPGPMEVDSFVDPVGPQDMGGVPSTTVNPPEALPSGSGGVPEDPNQPLMRTP